MSGAARTAPSPASSGARRVVFIDLTRALAAVFMLYGHVIDALLAPVHRTGVWHDAWLFQRGLTSCLFLLLSGFAFSIATARHWAAQRTLSASLVKRLRRFGTFVLLGYALHVPLSPIYRLSSATEAQWRNFLSVDVLQLIGVSFLGVQLLVLLAGSPGGLAVTALSLAVVIPAVTPAVWAIPWQQHLPIGLAAYLYPDTSSLFPLFPWSAYVLLGVGLGQIYARWDSTRLPAFTNTVLFLPGAIMVLAALGLMNLPSPPFGNGPYAFVPSLVLVRAGTCLLALGMMAHLGRHISRLPHVVGAFAQETLIIYFVHVSLVYGSTWTPGLANKYGMSLTPGQTLLVVVLLVAAMAWLAFGWNRLKHARPRAARWTAIGVGVLMVVRLLL